MWFVPLVIEVLTDFGINYWFASNTDSYSFVGGLDFSTFIDAYWFPLFLYCLMLFIGTWVAIPSDHPRMSRYYQYRGHHKFKS